MRPRSSSITCPSQAGASRSAAPPPTARSTSSSVGCDSADAASSATRVSRGSNISRSRTTDASVPGSGSAGSSRIAPLAHGASQLEREHRVPAGQLVDPPQLGPREDEVEPVAQEAVERAEAERGDPQPPQPLLPERAVEVERGGRASVLPQREQEGDALLAQAAQRELEDEGGGPVEPLEVVDRDGDGLGPREHPERSGEAERDGPLIRGRAIRLLEEERHARAPWPAAAEAPAARPASASPRRSPSATNES